MTATEQAPPPFVDADWLRHHRADVVLADVRWSLDGSEDYSTYRRSHLPGAVYVDLDSVLAAPPTEAGGRHPLPSASRFARGLGAAGIPDDAVVVAYDQGPGIVAARLAWMLRAIGQPAAVLEGGLAGWDGPVEEGEVVRDPVRRVVRPWPDDLFVSTEQVGALSPSIALIDARAASRYRGEDEPIDPRAGHIPGAVNLPCADQVDEHGHLLPLAELRERFTAAGVLDAEEVVGYCGSGVSACFDLLLVEHLDGPPARLYPGSWSAWSANPQRPAATGP